MPSQHTGTIQIRAARLADGISSSSKPNQAILITDGWITSVGDQDAIQQQTPPGTKIIDLGTACITPGLIDGHTHLSLAGDGRTYVEMFADSDEMMVLTGARNKIGFTLKKGLARGYIAGPRLLTSGRPITCTGGHFHMCNEIADGEEQMRRSVRRLVHEGADYIKIMASGGGTEGTIPGLASYTTEELHAAVHKAHHFHLLTAAHCRAKESMVHAIEAGE